VWIAAACLTIVTAALLTGLRRSGPWRELRVCADPNNLPFSNSERQGFENRLAELVAKEMKAAVRYTWWPQRRGFVRNTLQAGMCDVVMGVPSSYELVRTTRPYYRSNYVFLYRRDSPFRIHSLDDPALRDLRIGVHMIGDDSANAPPAHALSSRGMVRNIVGYSIYGDYSAPNPPARLVDAVARQEVDLAVIWGPFAGYFGARQQEPLEMTPVSPEIDLPFLPFVYDISMGVRREDARLQAHLDRILIRKAAQIDAILTEFGIPHAKRIRRTADAGAPGR
jgi:mxaJ protein